MSSILVKSLGKPDLVLDASRVSCALLTPTTDAVGMPGWGIRAILHGTPHPVEFSVDSKQLAQDLLTEIHEILREF